jgi:uncharacterized membrane protein
MIKLRSHSLKLSFAALAAFCGAILLEIPSGLDGLSHGVEVGKTAVARSSGGRAGGGSFRSSSPSRSAPYQSSPRSNSQGRSNYGGGGIYVPPPVYYPQPGYGSSYGGQVYGGGSFLTGLLVLLIMGGGGIAGILWLISRMNRSLNPSSGQEISNTTFTVTKIQVALVAQARQLQADLAEISTGVDTDTSEGLLQLLQESTLALLRYPEYWTHVSAQSQAARSAVAAEQLVNSISIAERSKLSSETLVNVGGRTQRGALKPVDADEGPSAYIVVTFLVGTAHDKPLFEKISTEAELKAALEKLAGLSSDYLMTLELIWSPQDSSDSLTDDELLTEYSDLLQI